MITNLTISNIREFLASKIYALILIDAEWNNYKNLDNKFNKIAEEYPGDDFAFGILDASNLELLKEFEVLNLPAICYFFYGQKIKTVIGDNQNIKEQVSFFIEDCENGWF